MKSQKILLFLAALLLTGTAASVAQSLDRHHLYLYSNPADARKSPYAFRDFKEAVSHFTDSTTLYVAPGVYWVDDPDTPKVAVGKDGREPFGMVIKAKNIRFIGLAKDARDIVFASQRGQTQGAIGNFTMFDFWCDSLTVENMTMGNYCNVDLDYPRNRALSKPKRNEAITQAHVGYVHGKSLRAKNVRFISRLNLNPLNGAEQSYYEDCHFECTDDAMNGTAIYRHCNIDLYGQKPFWSTFGKGAMFIDCDFNVKSDNREMYFCKEGGPLTLIDCRYHASNDSIYLGWTAYPQRWLRCYQQNFTFNGRPYIIGGRQPENTIMLPDAAAAHAVAEREVPNISLSHRSLDLQTGISAPAILVSGEPCHWRVQKGFEQYVSLSATNSNAADGVSLSAASKDTIIVTPTNETDETADFCIEAYTNDGRVAACYVTIQPSPLPSPSFVRQPTISIENGIATLDYELALQGCRDESAITWLRSGIPVAVSHGAPLRQYRLGKADAGHELTAVILPKSHRSAAGEPVASTNALPISNKEISKGDDSIGKSAEALHEDFSAFPCQWQSDILPGYWTVDGYKPEDTAEFPWAFDTTKPMWEYGKGFNGAVGYGLLQAQRGARLMYSPVGKEYGNMALTLKVDPTKGAGQGFGSATGQYMDVCIKFDPRTLTGYALRIIRTTKHAKAVDFYLVEYRNGKTEAISEPISSTCYRTGCTITLRAEGNRLTAHVETAAPQPSGSALPNEVSLSAEIVPNPFGGIAIQHTGSCGESTTMLHQLDVNW